MVPRHYSFTLPKNAPDSYPLIQERVYPGIKARWKYTPVLQRSAVDTVVIHATAGSSTEGAVAQILKGAVAFHWCVPDEDEPGHGNTIWATWPESTKGVHVRNHNSHTLGIELVNRQNKTDPFSDWQVSAAAEIVRYCHAKYPNLRTVCSHAALDPSRREDPGPQFPWDIFKELCLAPYPKADAPKVTAAAKCKSGAGDLCC